MIISALKYKTNNSVPFKNLNNQNGNYCNDFRVGIPSTTAVNHPSFGIKSTELNDLSLACANRFKLNLEKFKTVEDLKLWAYRKLKKIRRISKYKKKNNKIYNEHLKNDFIMWHNFLKKDRFFKENNELTLMIWESITKELNPKDLESSKLLPPFDKDALMATVFQIKEKLKSNPKININFNKLYKTNLYEKYTKDLPETGWVKIESLKGINYMLNKNRKFEDIKKLELLATRIGAQAIQTPTIF